MSMKNDLTEKLRALLNRNGRTDAEAATAEAMAAMLAEKHGINLDALAADAPPVIVTERVVGEWGRQPHEAEFAAIVCAEFFEVDPVTSSGLTDRLVFVGTERHLEIAEHVFKFLCREFRWRWEHQRGRCRNRREFLFGCMAALLMKLRARNAHAAPRQTEALEVSLAAKRDAFKREKFPNLKSTPIKRVSGRSSAAARGMAAGEKIEIRPAVRAGQKPAQQEQLGLFDQRLLR